MFRENSNWLTCYPSDNHLDDLIDFPDVDEEMKNFNIFNTYDTYTYLNHPDYLVDEVINGENFVFLHSDSETVPTKMMELVPPNEILPMESAADNLPIDPFIHSSQSDDISLHMDSLDTTFESLSATESSSVSSISSPESYDPLNDGYPILTDKFLNVLIKDDFRIEDIIEGAELITSIKIKEEALPSIGEEKVVPAIKIKEEPLDSIFDEKPVPRIKIKEEPLPKIEQLVIGESITCQKAYHFDNDHCYSKSIENKYSEMLKGVEQWSSMGSPDSPVSSSEEVDVVTVTEDLHPHVVPKGKTAYRNRRQKRGLKTPKTKKQNSLSPRTLNAAMKRNITRTTTNRRTYNRRKINNSVETTPSNSLPSSTNSSRCSSDVEDVGKRANHNSSERKRREVLRNCLQLLRENVPAIENSPKCAKVQILTEAKSYIEELQRDNECLLVKVGREKSKINALKCRLKKLQAHFRSYKFMAEKQLLCKL